MSELREMLEKQLDLETEARDLYDNYINKFKDPEIVKVLEKIRNDEIKHIKIVEQMIGLL